MSAAPFPMPQRRGAWLPGSLLLLAPGMVLATGLDTAAGGGTADVVEVDTGGYHFDVSLFRGSSVSQDVVQRIARAQVPAGTYKADVYVNGKFVQRSDINLAEGEGGRMQTCLPQPLVAQAGLLLATTADGQQPPTATADCVVFEQAVEGGAARFDLARLRLDLDVPHALLKHTPRGYVDLDALDRGATLAYVNYNGNYYRVSNDSHHQDFGYLSLDMGFNMAGWQLRQSSNVNHSDAGTHWRTLRQYLQRPLPGMGAQLVLGETFTTGRFLSGLSYTGASLTSDERMLPDSMRGYAPTVRGIARTRARVSIRQNGHEVHQVTVAPGPFEINDLYPTSLDGDLEVEVMEADGAVSRFTVPFSAVPESLRPGRSRYNLVLGRTRDMGDDSVFMDASYQRGLSNRITALGALRVADGYQAAVFGGAFASTVGAFGLDLTYARADVPQQGTQDGWMAHISYSRMFSPTHTTLSLAGYRYSTDGYRDFSDVLGLREADAHGWEWSSSRYRQRQRFELSVNQSLGRWGTLFATGSQQHYRDGRRRDSQYQLGYGNAFSNGVSVNLAVARQVNSIPVDDMGWSPGSWQSPPLGAWNDVSNRRETTVSLSISVPLGRARASRTPTLTTSYAHSDFGGSQYQATLTGMADAAQTVSYSVGASRQTDPSSTTFNASLNKRMPRMLLGVNASHGDDYWQAGANVQGALVAHGGGITFGPYLGETFGLIEAKGARGARVSNDHNVRIDRRGYALLPSVMPYRYNSISLDPASIDSHVELLDGTQRVAPFAGVGAKVVFRTRTGLALLVNTGDVGGLQVPMGAEVVDDAGQVVGMAGQGGQVYARVDKPVGTLQVRWGNNGAQACRIHYDAKGQQDAALVRLQAACAPGEKEGE